MCHTDTLRHKKKTRASFICGNAIFVYLSTRMPPLGVCVRVDVESSRRPEYKTFVCSVTAHVPRHPLTLELFYVRTVNCVRRKKSQTKLFVCLYDDLQAAIMDTIETISRLCHMRQLLWLRFPPRCAKKNNIYWDYG